MTDRHTAALTQRNNELATTLLHQARLATPDTAEQATALMTALSVVIELSCGTALAPAGLLALVEPTIDAWQAPGARQVVQ